MEQYLDLLKNIKEKGTHKPAARAGMPGSTSLFGYQFRHNLAEGFPLLTTKKMFWKGVVTELLWFLKGDTNIKYLIDNGVNIWNEDAYNYYLKQCKKNGDRSVPIEEFVNRVKNSLIIPGEDGYKLGDCGYQYGKVWRDWEGAKGWECLEEKTLDNGITYCSHSRYGSIKLDQIANVIKSLKETPESRRHIVTAIDPAHQDDLALYWCHALFQFNCRPLTTDEKLDILMKQNKVKYLGMELQPGKTVVTSDWGSNKYEVNKEDWENLPKYYLDCQLYQRSADVFLGVPFNIASYALLTHIIAKIVGMIPGEFIHTFGDVHIYDNHMEAVNEQLKRTPNKLPKLILNSGFEYHPTMEFLEKAVPEMIILQDYNPQPPIKGELSTGLQK